MQILVLGIMIAKTNRGKVILETIHTHTYTQGTPLQRLSLDCQRSLPLLSTFPSKTSCPAEEVLAAAKRTMALALAPRGRGEV